MRPLKKVYFKKKNISYSLYDAMYNFPLQEGDKEELKKRSDESIFQYDDFLARNYLSSKSIADMQIIRQVCSSLLKGEILIRVNKSYKNLIDTYRENLIPLGNEREVGIDRYFVELGVLNDFLEISATSPRRPFNIFYGLDVGRVIGYYYGDEEVPEEVEHEPL